jgi:23S rRNA (cytosine1962-C5)-methyltransferase
MKNNIKQQIKIFYSEDWKDYELLDTGEGEKLEKFGPYIFVRPYEDAVWKKTLSEKEWNKADGKFWSSKTGAKSGWVVKHPMLDKNKKWEMSYKGIKFLASPTPFRHLGFFPEQASHWDFIENAIRKATEERKINPVRGREGSQRPSASNGIKFLNLFGYTGVASLFALRAGAEVTHLDASKQTLNWAKENQKLNAELAEMPMRIIEDDAIKFLEREEKRGNKYDAIIMDPPKFGRGPKGETWNIEKDLPKLLSQVKKILSNKPLFIILNSYAIDSSSLSLGYALSEMMQDFKGKVEVGELAILEKSKNRLIPLSNTAIWENKK